MYKLAFFKYIYTVLYNYRLVVNLIYIYLWTRNRFCKQVYVGMNRWCMHTTGKSNWWGRGGLQVFPWNSYLGQWLKLFEDLTQRTTFRKEIRRTHSLILKQNKKVCNFFQSAETNRIKVTYMYMKFPIYLVTV